ncbi:bifunctional phosphoribosylaminoimidazolecarboxamide formyltransferase/IMP cyclohydrolase [Stygiomarasmius scandens]|uniref:Bifunctional phosphoribosylaminoimidazolecarboxamide formyltransferase/IMP cyclohydrolase n=1 Tax=Marasmiellus scandens TaxID=2682957 RepID=A0ABR1JWY4_9AGAR
MLSKKLISEVSNYSVQQPRIMNESVLSDPTDYASFLDAFKSRNGDVIQAFRSNLALKSFEMTAKYDEVISGYFREQYAYGDLPKEKLAGTVQRIPFRYDANSIRSLHRHSLPKANFLSRRSTDLPVTSTF